MKHQESVKVIREEIFRLGGIIFGSAFMHMYSHGEARKELEVNDMLTGLFEGELKKEWGVENMPEYEKLMKLVQSVIILSKDV